MDRQYSIRLYADPNEPSGLEIAFTGTSWDCTPKIIKITDANILVHLPSHSAWAGIGQRTLVEAEYILFKRDSPQLLGEREFIEVQERVVAGRRSKVVKQELLAKMEGN